MDWFDEQIRQRKLSDDQLFDESFKSIADAVLGKKSIDVNDKIAQSKEAIDKILSFYGCKIKHKIEGIEDINEYLENACRPFGIMSRRIALKEGWRKDAVGAILGFLKEGHIPVALIPSAFTYTMHNTVTGEKILVTRKIEKLLENEAYYFYKPFPLRKLKVIDLIKYSFATRSLYDICLIILFTLIGSLIGLLTPKITYFLYNNVVEEKSLMLLISTMTFYLCVLLSTKFFNVFKCMIDKKINQKMAVAVESATMMRILSLPSNFFRNYSSGELSQRISYVGALCETFMSMIFNTGLTSIFSLIYINSIFMYAPTLVAPSIIIILLTVIFSTLTSFLQVKHAKKTMEINSKMNGLTYGLVSGISKIRLSGSEKRAFGQWAKTYSRKAELTFNPPMFIKINGVFNLAISSIGTLVLYFLAVKANISVADYSAFTSSYAMVAGAITGTMSIVFSFVDLKPSLDMIKPILDCVPEVSENKTIVTKLKGDIELNNVSFKYNESMPVVVDNLSLKIKSGQYVAIVGKTGCGKSTLIRLLLGFEKPQKGAIYYDGKDLASLDLKSLRKNIGTVMQDSHLLQGDIYSNITISAPWLTLDEAWKAAEVAGIADDIRAMPMGMHTLISEGGGGISGGQRQRLVIARAIAPKPNVLIFDEATSALDNITQKKISDALDTLNCTRIVIAHRLSTIKHCDRILYLEDGKILEDGTYDELIKYNGKFAQLVERQRLS